MEFDTGIESWSQLVNWRTSWRDFAIKNVVLSSISFLPLFFLLHCAFTHPKTFAVYKVSAFIIMDCYNCEQLPVISLPSKHLRRQFKMTTMFETSAAFSEQSTCRRSVSVLASCPCTSSSSGSPSTSIRTNRRPSLHAQSPRLAWAYSPSARSPLQWQASFVLFDWLNWLMIPVSAQ